MQLVKHLIILFSFLFSFNVFAVRDLLITKDALTCDDSHTKERYSSLHTLIEQISDTHLNAHLMYNLAKVSLCLNKDAEGIEHLHRASDAGHILATLLIGIYHKFNQTFSSVEKVNSLKNLNQAIHYFTKGAQLITSLSNYPRESSNDMEYIESESYPSYHLFAQLPFLHFKKYTIALDDSMTNKETKISNTTLEILDKIIETSSLCLKRKALSVWREARDIIYNAQQMRCTASLNFAKAAYPLEQQRIQISQNCITPLKACNET